MAETKKVIEIKKRKLKEEFPKPKPNKQLIKRLKDSINRHTTWEKQHKQKRERKKKWLN